MVVARNGRYGPYVTEVLDDDARKAKPQDRIAVRLDDRGHGHLDDALRLMSLPRVVGVDDDGVEITAQNGRYGPYLKKGTDSRSLESEDQIFSITLDEARAIYAQPKQRGRAAAKPPLAELGPDPVSGRPMIIKDGRFGAYVTDGETNATLRRGDEIATITAERAAELLAEKRAKGPAPKKRAAKKTAARRRPARAPATEGRRPRSRAKKPPPRPQRRLTALARRPLPLGRRRIVSTGVGGFVPWRRASGTRTRARAASPRRRPLRPPRPATGAGRGPARIGPPARPAVLRPALQRRRPAADQPRPRSAQPGRPGGPQRGIRDRRHAARRPRPPADPLRGAAGPPGAGRPRRVVPDRARLAAAAAQGPDRADGSRGPARRVRRPAPAPAPPGTLGPVAALRCDRRSSRCATTRAPPWPCSATTR